MASYPARRHTAYGLRQAAYTDGTRIPLCQRGHEGYAPGLGQPDPDCDCQACQRYFAPRGKW